MISSFVLATALLGGCPDGKCLVPMVSVELPGVSVKVGGECDPSKVRVRVRKRGRKARVRVRVRGRRYGCGSRRDRVRVRSSWR